jgi:hypothetical protein
MSEIITRKFIAIAIKKSTTTPFPKLLNLKNKILVSFKFDSKLISLAVNTI